MQIAEKDLQKALVDGELVPYFQPLVDLRSGGIHGFEILARWQHPTHGLIPQSDFLPLIDRAGLFNQLTASLLNQAFAAARELPPSFGLSVNFAPSQLHDRTLPDLVHRLADKAEFDLKRLTVELTETALVDDLDLARAVADDFKKLGTRLALDDFGTGYSSLLHLQVLPFDELKVDITFVRSMVESRQSRKITAAVISLGLSLGVNTVAEGIEEQSQANLLAWQGCNLGQGYLYGRPLPAADLLTVLTNGCSTTGVTAEVPANIVDPFLSLDARPTERLSQLRAIYDGSPVGLAFVNADLRYVNLNQKLAEFNGHSVQAHLGRQVSEMVDPGAYAQFEAYLKRALSGEPVSGVEVTKRPPNQPETTLMLSYQPVHDETGEILGVCVSVADITPFKQKEEALRESENHYRYTIELTPQIPWVMDAEGDNLSISSRWESVTGFTEEQNRHYGYMEAIHEQDRPHVLAVLAECLPTGTPIDMEFRVLTSDGTSVWMRSRGAPRRDADGKIIRWYGSVEVIDEHKRAVDELSRNEARLRAIFNAVPVGIVFVESLTGKVLSANPRAEQLLGFRFKANMIWNPQAWEMSDRQGRSVDHSHFPLERAMNRHETTEAEEILLHRPDGSRIWLSLTAAPICLENGAQFGGILVVQDIDADKQEQQRLLELVRELSLMASRTSEACPNLVA